MFGRQGGWITARSPAEFVPLVRRVGALWDPGARHWLIEQRRIGPVIRELRRMTDPLFRTAGMDLDR